MLKRVDSIIKSGKVFKNEANPAAVDRLGEVQQPPGSTVRGVPSL